MKICVISFHCCPFSRIGADGVGGMNVYLKELCSVLAGFPKVEIDIFTRIQNPNIQGIRPITPSLRVIHLPAGPESPMDRRKLYDYLSEYTNNLKAFILRENENYDLIYSHYWLSGLIGEKIKRRLGIPLVFTYHTLGFLKLRALGKGEHAFRVGAEQHLSREADEIISSSIDEKESLVEEFAVSPEKIRVIYPGVNKNLFYPENSSPDIKKKNSQSDYTLLYVGRIEPVKGLGNIIRALEILRNKDKDLYSKLKLNVVGGGRKDQDFSSNPELVRIQRMVEEKQMQEIVEFLGSKNQEELRKIYSSADALVVPSLYESFGLVVVEALACGTPVIVSNIGKMKSIVREGKTGFSFKPHDPFSLAACLQNFFPNKDYLWDESRIRKDIIDRFSWEKTAAESYKAFCCLEEKASRSTTTLRPDESLQPV